jgi:hypothetical protein
MQTVNFQCGHCRNLMAVGTDYLGQQVRCPHCGQVVVAPPPPSPATPFAALSAPSAPEAPPATEQFRPVTENDHEDIFSPPVEDSLFGESDGPRLEIPRSPSPAPAPLPPLPAPEMNGDQPVVMPELTPISPPDPFAGQVDAFGGSDLRTPWQPGATTTYPGLEPAPPEHGEAAPETQLTGGPTVSTPRRPQASGMGLMSLILLVILPLGIWAVMATAAAVILYVRAQTAPASSFDQMPDAGGDAPGVKAKRAAFKYDVKWATAQLPAHLITPLGKPIAVGDVEVTPVGVERRTIELRAASAPDKPESSIMYALVLNLRVKNLSKRWAFVPLDNYFDRAWKVGSGGPPPLTQLEAGRTRFFGGPCKWFPADSRDAHKREWLEGRTNLETEGLQPGKEMDSLVATDAWDPATAAHLFGTDPEGRKLKDKEPYHGPLLWRVHVRRGTIAYRGREVAATAVIGVSFTDRDYLKEG